VVGSDAVARWDWGRETVTLSRHGAEDEVFDVRCDLAETYRAELGDFVQSIEFGGEPAAPAGAGLAAVRLAAAIKHSALAGQRIRLDRQ